MKVKLARARLLYLCAVVIVLAVIAVAPQAVCAQATGQNATFVDWGAGEVVYNNYTKAYDAWAGIIDMNYVGTIYESYCIDLYTIVQPEDNLTINGPLTNESTGLNADWCAVNYILNNFDGSNNDSEAAAIQAAIWYFTTAHYGPWPNGSGGPHQFMTDPNTTPPYDGYRRDYAPEGYVRQRAFEMINSVPRVNGNCTFLYPTKIELEPSDAQPLYNQTINLTATVYDQHNANLPNITVNFSITAGSGTLDSTNGTTNNSGKVQTNLTVTNTSVTVVAWVEGRYGTLLHGEMYTEPRQNMTTVTTIPRSLEDFTVIVPIPELPTVALLGTGLLALIGYVRYRRTKKSF